MKPFFYKYYFVGIAVLLFAYTAKINWSDGQWQYILKADARGYYAYLPAAFIYHDLNFGHYQKVEVENAYDSTLVYDYRQIVDGKVVNKYFAGEALLLAPFFGIAHFLSTISGHNSDGYSQIYMIFVTLAALFYVLLGLFFIKKTLQLFKIHRPVICLVLIAILFGTNLFYYTIGEPGMSHVYSFAMVSFFLHFAVKYLQSAEMSALLWATVALGLVIIVRPVNILILVAVPWLAPDFKTFADRTKVVFRQWPQLIVFIGVFLLIVSLQAIVYKLQTNHWWVYSYGKEGFDFSRFQLYDFLWSYKKGFFLYTPLCFLIMLGMFTLSRDKYFAIGMFLFLTILMYLLSSWWNWYYGGSFSSRVMVDFLPVFALILGRWLNEINQSYAKWIFIGLIGCFITINQIQTLQYRYFIIHWSNMTQEKYWDVFLDLSTIIERK